MTQFYCYIHKRKDGTPFYVGKGSKNRAFSFTQRNVWHKNIVAKEGGKHNIIVEIYPAVDEHNAFYLETVFIKGLSLFFELCNLTYGGEGPAGFSPSIETRNKLSLALSGTKHPNFGKHLSEDTKNKIRAANSKYKPTEDIRRNLAKKYTGSGHPGFGKSRTEATKEKIRVANSGASGSGAKVTLEQVKEIRYLYENKLESQRNWQPILDYADLK